MEQRQQVHFMAAQFNELMENRKKMQLFSFQNMKKCIKDVNPHQM